MEFFDLLKLAESENIEVITWNFQGNLKGLYCDNYIAISNKLETSKEKKCILAEELGHYFMNAGNILNTKDIVNLKQEKLGRAWAYKKLVNCRHLIDAYKSGVRTFYELAEHLNVTEEFLKEAITYYKRKYNPYYKYNNYIIYFNPLYVIEVWK